MCLVFCLCEREDGDAAEETCGSPGRRSYAERKAAREQEIAGAQLITYRFVAVWDVRARHRAVAIVWSFCLFLFRACSDGVFGCVRCWLALRRGAAASSEV